MNRKARQEKRTNPDVETLRCNPAYKLVYELGFEDMIPFVLNQIKKKGLFSWLYLVVNVLLLAIILLLLITALLDHTPGWKSLLIQAVLGVLAGSILVIPIHELIHGLVYRILGSGKIIFGADLKQLFFFVTANQYVVCGKQIYLLALSPFVLINLLTIVATIKQFPQWAVFAGFFLMSHNIMCIGDFAISNFVSRAKGKIYNFDEPEKKMSYFFEEL